MIRRTFVATVEPVGEREIVARASDENLGRDGYILRTAGIDLTSYRLNPVVLDGHDASKPVGNCTSIRTVGTELICRIAFAPAGISPEADRVCALCKAGVLNTLSVGFDPIETQPLRNGVREVSRCELLEISIVAIPALPSATILQRRYGGSARAAQQRAPLSVEAQKVLREAIEAHDAGATAHKDALRNHRRAAAGVQRLVNRGGLDPGVAKSLRRALQLHDGAMEEHDAAATEHERCRAVLAGVMDRARLPGDDTTLVQTSTGTAESGGSENGRQAPGLPSWRHLPEWEARTLRTSYYALPTPSAGGSASLAERQAEARRLAPR